MVHQPGLGLAADNDFFDWATDTDQRFFLAGELAGPGGFPLHARRAMRAAGRSKLPPRYRPETLRSAS